MRKRSIERLSRVSRAIGYHAMSALMSGYERYAKQGTELAESDVAQMCADIDERVRKAHDMHFDRALR